MTSCVVLRKRSTARNSSGAARTTTTPDCGLTTTLRPSSLPTIACNEVRNSFQKSESLVVSMLLEATVSRGLLLLPLPLLLDELLLCCNAVWVT